MKILGLDVSSTSTGFGVIEHINGLTSLVDFGLIRGDSSMTTTQRLYFQGNELKKIIEKHAPDEIGIEETVLVRGPKIMRILSRFSGVAIFQSYSYQKKELHFFEPSMWKKMLNIGGNAVKCEIQLEVCTRFNKLNEKQIAAYKEKLIQIEKQVADYKAEAKTQKINKEEKSKQVKIIEKQYSQMSTDIFSDSGLNADIADSISVAIATALKLNEKK